MSSSWHSILKQAGSDYTSETSNAGAGERRNSIQQARVLQAVQNGPGKGAVFSHARGAAQPQPVPAPLPKAGSWRTIVAASFSGAIAIGLTGYAFLGRGDAGERVSQQAVEFAKAIDDVKSRIKPVLASIEVPAPLTPQMAPGQKESLAVPDAGAGVYMSHLQPATEDAFLEGASKQLRFGNIAGARTIYETLVHFGSQRAAMALAETYDPFVLAWRQSDVTQSDAKRARQWYQKAADLGSKDARERLDEMEKSE
jgi:hypothetical protein